MSTKTVEKKIHTIVTCSGSLQRTMLAMTVLRSFLLEVILVIVLPMIMKLDPYTSDILAFSAKPGSGTHFRNR